jgi:hypothetical protein
MRAPQSGSSSALLLMDVSCRPRTVGRYLVGGPLLLHRCVSLCVCMRAYACVYLYSDTAAHLDLYILGHGMDMVELHLWWLFVFRARNRIAHNRYTLCLVAALAPPSSSPCPRWRMADSRSSVVQQAAHREHHHVPDAVVPRRVRARAEEVLPAPVLRRGRAPSGRPAQRLARLLRPGPRAPSHVLQPMTHSLFIYHTRPECDNGQLLLPLMMLHNNPRSRVLGNGQ